MLFFMTKLVSFVLLCFSPMYLFAAPVVPNPNGVGNIVFQPVNQDVDIIAINDSGVDWDYTLFMFDNETDISAFDPNSPGFVNGNDILSVHPIPTQINFSELVVTHQTTGDTLDLTDNNNFIFALWNHDYLDGSWVEATSAELFSPGIPDVFNIFFHFDNPDSGLNEVVAFAVDVVPVAVPIPGALLLFISGLVGLFGFQRFKPR